MVETPHGRPRSNASLCSKSLPVAGGPPWLPQYGVEEQNPSLTVAQASCHNVGYERLDGIRASCWPYSCVQDQGIYSGFPVLNLNATRQTFQHYQFDIHGQSRHHCSPDKQLGSAFSQQD